MKKCVVRLTSVLLAFIIMLMSLPVCFGDSATTTTTAKNINIGFANEEFEYLQYSTDYNNVNNAKKEIKLNVESAVCANGATVSLSENGFLWKNGNGTLSWNVDVPQTAKYCFLLDYAFAETGVDYDFGLKLDGEYPFGEASKIVFSRQWKNTTDDRKFDKNGNELTPEQCEETGTISAFAKDNTGVVVDPYEFYFSAGKHTITLVGSGQSIKIVSAAIVPSEKTEKYSKPNNIKKTGNESDIIYIEGESATLKTSSSLIPKSDSSDAGMSPANPFSTVMNYIGGTSWSSPGQTLVWNFNVKKSGYYYFGARYRQSDVVNAESWRWLKIDGKTPFEEAKKLRFAYCPKWDNFIFGEDKPYAFYIEKGEHTISLEVTLGEMSEYYSRMNEIVSILGDKYIDIVKITGSSPDINLDYELFRQIPDLNEKLTLCYKKLTTLSNDLSSFTGKRGSQYIAAINNMARIIKKMIDAPYIAHQYVNDYYTNYSSLSSWLYDMKSMPLYLDYMELVPYGLEYKKNEAGFLKKLIFGAKRLAISFTDDYVGESDVNKKDGLRLWVNWGRDQASVLDTLIRDSFTAETGIPVRLEITNASLVNGILSGNYPDMALQMARTEPVNLGLRGALCDLRQFDDLSDVLERFQKDADIPYRLNDALYALPDSQSFYMLFYRKDILNNLGLTVPKTWDDFLYDSAIIQRNNMNVYIPYTMITASTTVNVGVGSLNLFPTLMGQNNLSIYNKKQNATALNSPKAINVFDFWTKLYTDYEYLKEADFYNRFRVGTMPMGISAYSLYMTLYSAAPEIDGRWGIACLPGTVGGNDSVAGSGTGCSIINKSKHKKEAWEFLKWWTNSDTQKRYANNIEALLGMLGRPQTSNIEALNSLAWKKEDLSVILQQWEKVKEIPEVPGSYYLSRAIDQAYWSVLNDGVLPKDAMVKWSEVADAEIARKISEYS